MKAKYMARRLNTLLHDLKLRPGAALTTRDQLEALFRTEVERMGEHLDNLRLAARRIGSDPMLAVRADIEIGWAYRLIEMFGTMRRLGFDKNCPARQALERAGIPEHSIEVITQTFAQEQAACRQAISRMSCSPTWSDTAFPTRWSTANATAQFMRAKADMLLDAPSRYPEVEGLSVSALLGDTKALAPDPNGAAAEQQKPLHRLPRRRLRQRRKNQMRKQKPSQHGRLWRSARTARRCQRAFPCLFPSSWVAARS